MDKDLEDSVLQSCLGAPLCSKTLNKEEINYQLSIEALFIALVEYYKSNGIDKHLSELLRQ